jgi:hypothetical protein
MKEEKELDKLEEILVDRISERKKQIGQSNNNIVINDRLWAQIETLEQVLGEIRTLQRTLFNFTVCQGTR